MIKKFLAVLAPALLGMVLFVGCNTGVDNSADEYEGEPPAPADLDENENSAVAPPPPPPPTSK